MSNWGLTEAIKYHMEYPFKDYDYGIYADKHKVKDFVKDTINVSKEYAYFTTPEEIDNYDYDGLPDLFVIKGVHGSGHRWNIIVKNNFNREVSIAKMKNWLNIRYNDKIEKYYAHVTSGVLIEEYLGHNINDYKFYMFHGEVGFIQFVIDRYKRIRQNNYDEDWNRLPFKKEYPNKDIEGNKPDNLREMIKVSRQLAGKVGNPPIVRVDIYSIDGVLYFGEYTFTPAAGTCPLSSSEYEMKYGAMIKKI